MREQFVRCSEAISGKTFEPLAHGDRAALQLTCDLVTARSVPEGTMEGVCAGDSVEISHARA
jgi:hypothetical protein